MKDLKILLLLFGALACSPSHAEFEACFFERVTQTVALTENIGLWDFFTRSTAHDIAMAELADEVIDQMGNLSGPNYYQIRYQAQIFGFASGVPVTTCLNVDEDETVEEAVESDEDDDEEDSDDSDSGSTPVSGTGPEAQTGWAAHRVAAGTQVTSSGGGRACTSADGIEWVCVNIQHQ